MCTSRGTKNFGDLVFRPHRFFGLPSLIDPMMNPYDKYNLPEVEEAPDPKKAARQKMVAAQAGTTGFDVIRRRRDPAPIAGVTTGTLGYSGQTAPIRVGGG